MRLVEQSKVKEASTYGGKKCFYSANRAAVAQHAVVGVPDLSKFIALVAPDPVAAAQSIAAMSAVPIPNVVIGPKGTKK
jgi:hypothetical protein